MADITGTTGNDTLTGTDGADVMTGLAGNDVLDGGAGADHMDGGSGDDTYFVDQLGDVIVEAAGEGYDYVVARSSYVLSAGASVELMSTTDNNGTAAINLTGNELSNIILGNAGANRLDGGAGGVDTLLGLGGDDTYFVDADDIVIEAAGEGYDYVVARSSYVLGAGASVELMSTTDNNGTASINLTGNSFSNIILGNAGVNRLDGGAGGIDTLLGFGGDDTYFVDADDSVIEAAGEGYDYVVARSSYVLSAGASIELMSTTDNGGTASINLTGNSFSNIILGNAGVNRLDGGAGGIDTLLGFGGDDTYFVDGDDTVIEAAGEGYDYVVARSSYVLSAGASIELMSTTDNGGTTAINLTGNSFSNIILGNAGVNRLDGGAGGVDTLLGLGGDDTYFVDADDIVIEAAGEGYDYVVARSSYVLSAGASVELMSTTDNNGTAAINLTGNAFSNIILGNAGVNRLDGGAGGIDTLLGFGGDDTYFVDADDIVIEAAGEGYDYVVARSSYVLGAGASVELMSTTDNNGTAAINLTGNAFSNIILGNAGANRLDGGLGNDTLIGGGGNDVIAFTTALGAGNIDTIVDWGLDTILLGGEAGQPFAALASGLLAPSAFVVGAAALSSSQVIIYNQATGALFYDADGNGAGAAVQFATVSSGTNLTLFDFLVSGPENHKPVITSPNTASVVENSPISTIVYQAVASDADGDRVSYALGGDDGHLFTVDGAGAVRLNAPANFENRTTYSFTLTASDSGSTSDTVTVGVAVINVNEGTGTINETGAFNDTSGSAQTIGRDELIFATNPNLPNDDLPSTTILGNVSQLADKDFFAITLQAGERLILDVDGTDGLDSFVEVVNVGNNDDLEIFDPGSVPTIADHNVDSFFSFRAPTAGIYYFSIQSFEGDTLGAYRLNVSVGPPATLAEIISEDIDALISGSKWASPNLTYAFPTNVNQYPADIDETDPPSDFAPFTAIQQQVTTQLLQLAANVSSLTFQLADPATAQLRFAMSNEAEPAYAYYPPRGGGLGGTAWFNKQDFNSPVKGDYAWMAILHEAGHTLGLKHGHEGPAISPERDSLEYTVMTYRSYVGQGVGPNDGYANEDWGYAQTLMMLDIAALQRIYGANFSYNATDTTYRWNPGTGEFSINGSGQGAPGGNRVFMTLWDGGGTDTYDLSNYGNGVTINLRPGEWTTTSATQIANLGDGHNARGNVANALLFEGDTRSLIENAVGGGGNDTIVANQAANRLTGNGADDTFRWLASADAGVGAQADTITDFVRGSDRIDLGSIDAKPGNPSSDNFTFIGTAAFSNVEGELRYQVEGANLRIQGDLDGNGIADMEIIVSNQTLLAASDFFL